LIKSNHTQIKPYESDYLTKTNLETAVRVARRKTKLPRVIATIIYFYLGSSLFLW